MNHLQFKRGIYFLLVGVSACVLGICVYAHFIQLDGVGGLIWPIFFKDTTVYAPKYEDHIFKQLGIGESSEIVLEALGHPLQKDICGGKHRWRYTESQSDSHYRMRQITLEQGVVVSKQSYYLID